MGEEKKEKAANLEIAVAKLTKEKVEKMKLISEMAEEADSGVRDDYFQREVIQLKRELARTETAKENAEKRVAEVIEDMQANLDAARTTKFMEEQARKELEE